MFQETSPEILNEIITITANEPGPGRLEVQSPPPQRRRRRTSEESESIAELVLQRNNTDDSEDDDSDGYSTPDEDEDEETVGVSFPPRLEANIPYRSRVLFTTPCGQILG